MIQLTIVINVLISPDNWKKPFRPISYHIPPPSKSEILKYMCKICKRDMIQVLHSSKNTFHLTLPIAKNTIVLYLDHSLSSSELILVNDIHEFNGMSIISDQSQLYKNLFSMKIFFFHL